MNHGSLFSGIGGFDLAAEWMGWNNVFHCEWNPFGQQVLKHHFPKSISYHDITKTDFSIHRGNIDIITGGFPCQPYSTAGLRKGKEDERHLFPEMLRAIKEVKPTWVVGENVRGLVSWNEGLVFHEVYDDLEREGYEVQSFLIPAAGVGAPHQRYRVWFVAYANDKGRSSRLGEIQSKNGEISEWNDNAKFSDTSIFDATNTNSIRHRGWSIKSQSDTSKKQQMDKEIKYNRDRIWSKIEGCGTNVTNSSSIGFCGYGEGERPLLETLRTRHGMGEKKRCKNKPNWDNFPTKSPICGGDDGIPRELDSISFPKWRNESIKAYGNAIVPQVAHQIFKAIKEFEELV